MSASQPARDDADSPEVSVLRKRIRGEPLTETEQALLAHIARKPTQSGPPITQEQLTALLDERTRQGG